MLVPPRWNTEKPVELHWAFVAVFVFILFHFIFMVNNRLLLAPTLNLSFFILLSFFLLFLHSMFTCVQHFVLSRMERCGSGLNVGMHTNQTIVFRFIFALTCTSYLFVCLMEPLYFFLLLGFSFVCVCVWWVVVEVVVDFSTAIVHSLRFSPTHSRSFRFSSASFPHLCCVCWKNSEWLWWTFMHLKLIEKNTREKREEDDDGTETKQCQL